MLLARSSKTRFDKLREKTTAEPKVDPIERLDSWLSKREDPIPEFELKPIDIIKLRKLMKKLKPSRSHGLDFIDSYSLQLAFPILEDSILHLVNLSISSRTYSKNWKFQLILPLHKKNDSMDGTNCLLVQAVCVCCHRTKCPLLTAFFSLSSSLCLRYFSPRRGKRRVPKFCMGS